MVFQCRHRSSRAGRELAHLPEQIERKVATVGLWVSESHRESGIGSHDPWPPHGMFWKSGHSRRHVSWCSGICACPAPGNGSSFVFISFIVIAFLFTRPHLYIDSFSLQVYVAQTWKFLSARVREYACSGLYSRLNTPVQASIRCCS